MFMVKSLRQGLAAIALVGSAFVFSSASVAKPYKVDPAHSYVQFSVVHLGIFPYPGRFTKSRMQLDYNPSNVESSKISVRIPIESLTTDSDSMDELLVGEQFFDKRNYPMMSFESTSIRRTSDTTGVIEGNLTIIGNTRKVAFDATFNGKAKSPFTGTPIIGIVAVAKINRMKWGLTAWRPFVGKEVTIEIGFEASPK